MLKCLMCRAAAVVLLLGVVSGCATPELSDQALQNPPPAKVFSQLPVSSHMGGEDPLEGFNRTVFYIGDGFYCYIYRPIGYVYGSIMPRFGVKMINNFTNNLEFPRRFLSSLLQAEFTWAGTELLRFLTNSTIGIAGFFDPATHWFDLPEHNEDFGQAFASWGIGEGCVLQLASSSNIRDGVGMIFDYAVDIKSYFYGGQAFTMLNRGLDPFDSYYTIRESTFDSYQLLKDYQLLIRYCQVNNVKPVIQGVQLDDNGQVIGAVVRKAEDGEKLVSLEKFYSQSPEIDTLRAGWFSPSRDSMWSRLSFFNTDFANLGECRSVEVAPDRSLEYCYWKSDKPDAPLVVILPGVGAHHRADMARALAELCIKNHFSALIVSNTMTWEFAESFDSPPGFAPDDAANLEVLLEKVFADLAVAEKELKPSRRLLLGYSQGALNAVHLMARQQHNNKLNIDRAVVINPPVDMLNALGRLDNFMRSADNMKVDDVIPLLASGAASYMQYPRCPVPIVNNGSPVLDKEGKVVTLDQVPVNQLVAELLIGYSFKRSLDDLLVSLHHKAPVNGIATAYEWGNRQALYDELALWNYQRYCQMVLMPYYKKRYNVDSLESLNRVAGLRAVENTLRDNKQITVLHNADDFLLTPADRKFLRDTLQERLIMFDHGGHLGNLYRQDVQQVIVKELKR